jgi:hypothetical protein
MDPESDLKVNIPDPDLVKRSGSDWIPNPDPQHCSDPYELNSRNFEHRNSEQWELCTVETLNIGNFDPWEN